MFDFRATEKQLRVSSVFSWYRDATVPKLDRETDLFVDRALGFLTDQGLDNIKRG